MCDDPLFLVYRPKNTSLLPQYWSNNQEIGTIKLLLINTLKEVKCITWRQILKQTDFPRHLFIYPSVLFYRIKYDDLLNIPVVKNKILMTTIPKNLRGVDYGF